MFLQGFSRALSSETQVRKAFHVSGNPVRVKASLSVPLSLLLLVLTVPAFSQSAPIQPLTTTELVAWLTAGISGTRLARMVRERGLATLPTNRELRQVESAGAGKDLMRVLNSGNVQSAQIGPA